MFFSSIAFSTASAVYFFPTEQSVPTVSNRFPVRLSPFPVSNSMLLYLRSCNLTPCLIAALDISSKEDNRECIPLAIFKPSDIAFTIISIQPSGIFPPALTTPSTKVLAPRFTASSREISLIPRLDFAFGRLIWPIHHSGRQ